MREFFEGIQNHDHISEEDPQNAARERRLQREFRVYQDSRYGLLPAGQVSCVNSVSRKTVEKVLRGVDANDFFEASQTFGRGKNRPKTRRVGNLTREDMTRKS